MGEGEEGQSSQVASSRHGGEKREKEVVLGLFIREGTVVAVIRGEGELDGDMGCTGAECRRPVGKRW